MSTAYEKQIRQAAEEANARFHKPGFATLHFDPGEERFLWLDGHPASGWQEQGTSTYVTLVTVGAGSRPCDCGLCVAGIDAANDPDLEEGIQNQIGDITAALEASRREIAQWHAAREPWRPGMPVRKVVWEG